MRRRQVWHDTNDDQPVEVTTPRRRRMTFKAVVKRWCLENRMLMLNRTLSATFGQEVSTVANAKTGGESIHDGIRDV